MIPLPVVLPDQPNSYFFYSAETIARMDWSPGAQPPASGAPIGVVLPETGGKTTISFKDGSTLETRFHPMQIQSLAQGTGIGIDPTQPLPAPPSQPNMVERVLQAGISGLQAFITSATAP